MRSSDPAVDAVLNQYVVGAHVAPGATACVARFEGPGWRYGVGAAGVRSARLPDRVTGHTLYDLASVTKPFVAVTLARLHERGIVSLDAPLGACVPWLRETAAADATLETLLSHRAGLEAHLELFAPLRAGIRVDPTEAAIEAASAMRSECRGLPSSAIHAPTYSDLGYFLVGIAIEQRTERPLDHVVAEEIAALGIHDIGSARLLSQRFSDFAERVAPTEVVGYRGGEVHGAVHDDNAWALAGLGMCGHAGLFGTALELGRFGSWLLDLVAGRGPGLAPTTWERLLRRRNGGTLRAGFDGKSPAGSSAGSRLGPETFGHLGFTGTSFWCDPESDVVVALLTNRVNPSRDNPSISTARPAVHDALVERASLTAKTQDL